MVEPPRRAAAGNRVAKWLQAWLPGRPGAPARVRFQSQNRVVGAGFEPAYDFRRTVLQTVAINHSATPPGARLGILREGAVRRHSSGGWDDLACGDQQVAALAGDAAVGAAFGTGGGFAGHVFPDIADWAGRWFKTHRRGKR